MVWSCSFDWFLNFYSLFVNCSKEQFKIRKHYLYTIVVFITQFKIIYKPYKAGLH